MPTTRIALGDASRKSPRASGTDTPIILVNVVRGKFDPSVSGTQGDVDLANKREHEVPDAFRPASADGIRRGAYCPSRVDILLLAAYRQRDSAWPPIRLLALLQIQSGVSLAARSLSCALV